MKDFEKELEAVLKNLKADFDVNGQVLDEKLSEAAKQLAQSLLKSRYHAEDVRANPEKAAADTKRILTKIQDEYSVDDTILVFRSGDKDERLTGFIQGDQVSIVAGIAFIVNKSNIPREIVMRALKLSWDDEKT